MQRKQPAILVKSLELSVIARIFHAKRTGESVLPNPAGRLSHLFLWEASEQSAFKDSIRRIATIRGFKGSIKRTQCDHKPMMWRKQLDFVSAGKLGDVEPGTQGGQSV